MLLGILIQQHHPGCYSRSLIQAKKELFFLLLYLDILCTVCHGKWEGRVGIQSAGVVPWCLLHLHLGADAGCPRLELGSNRWHRGHHLPVSFWQSLSNFIWETLLLSATPGDISHIFVTARLQAALAPFKCNDSIQIFSHHIKYFLLGRRLADGGLLDRWVMLRVRYLTQLSVHGSPWPAALRPPR